MRREKSRFLTLFALALFVAAASLGCPDDNDNDEDPDVGVDEDVIDDEDVEDDVVDEDVEEDVDPPPTLPEGQLSFDYDNDISGTFDVTGAAEVDAEGDLVFGTFAIAGLYEADEQLVIVASDGHSDPIADVLIMIVPDFDKEDTTFGFEEGCLDEAEPDCAFALFLRDISFDAFDNEVDTWVEEADEGYVFTTGELEITEFPDDEGKDNLEAVMGSFFGTATLSEENGDGDPSTLEVTDGSFDVPLVLN